MSCNCGKPKCDGKCGISPSVLQINNPGDCTLFHRVEVPASMGDSKTNPPKNGDYRNVLLYYVADGTSWLFSSDGIPQKLVNGFTDYEDAINLPQINGETLIGDKNSADLKLADAPMVITIASGNVSWSGADTAEDIYNFFLDQGKVNVVFEGSENYGYEIVSAAYIPGEQKMMCMTTVASADTGSSPVEFSGNALYGLMTFYTAGKAVDVGELDLQPKLFITDFTGLELNDNVLSGVPATDSSIGMVKPSDGLEVASDGTLSISDIEQYVHFFDTVADMQSATNLVDGSYARTLGYYSANDGGGALYKITNSSDTADGGSVINLTSLQAHLMTESDGTVNVRQFGAKGDDSTDNTTAIQNAIDYCCANNIKLFIPNGIYLVDKLSITQHLYMVGEDWVKTVIKAKENSTSTTGVIDIRNEGLNNSHYSNFYVEGNKANQTNEINGIYLYATTSKDYRTVLDTIFVHYCTANGIYIGGTVGGYSLKEIKLNKITVNACDEHGLNIESCTDSFWNNIVVSSCRKSGIRFKNGGNHKISNSKFFYNGKGIVSNSELEPAYRLYPTYHVTTDAEPVEGKIYYTLTFNASPYAVPSYTVFSGESFDADTTYYEQDSATYYKRYAGIILETASAIAISDCECQDNWGDGIYTYNSNHIVISSYLADRNGLLLNSSGDRVTYASQGMSRIYFGIFAYTTTNLNIQMSALATTSTGGQTQRGALYDYSCTRLNANIVSSNQDVDVDIRMSNPSTINFHKFWVILNGKPLTITYPLSYLTFRNDFGLVADTTQQKSYMKREGNRFYYRLNLTHTGGTPTGSNVNLKIIDPLPVGFRPYQTEVAFATFTDDLNRIGTLIAGATDFYGNYEVRGDNVATSYSNAVITGDFEINLE